jgi:hypothetical protein
MTQLKKNAVKFVTEVLTEVGGKAPSLKVVRATADKIVKVMEPVSGGTTAQTAEPGHRATHRQVLR